MITQTSTVENDWRFAKIVLRTWLDPLLADRYAADPHAVLEEFGLHVERGEQPPDLPAAAQEDLVIEDLASIQGQPLYTLCWSDADS